MLTLLGGWLLQAVESHGAARQDLALRRGGQLRPIGDELRRAGEETVGMGIVGGPQDLVRADVVREHGEAAFDGLERDPAVALEQLARAHREPGVVEALVVVVAVHAVEPRRDPPAARLEEADAYFRVTITDTFPDDA